MAEKRGQYQYNDDGTVSTLVSISGADANGGAVNTTSNDVAAFDHQATLTNTAVTHTSAVIAPSTSNIQSAWQQVPEGMTELINNLTLDAAAANVYTFVYWSEDGTTQTGNSSPTVATNNIQQKTSTQWYPVGGVFYKVGIWNGDAAPRTCNANIKFRP